MLWSYFPHFQPWRAFPWLLLRCHQRASCTPATVRHRERWQVSDWIKGLTLTVLMLPCTQNSFSVNTFLINAWCGNVKGNTKRGTAYTAPRVSITLHRWRWIWEYCVSKLSPDISERSHLKYVADLPRKMPIWLLPLMFSVKLRRQ